MSGNDRLYTQEKRQILVRIEVLDQRILELLNRLPAPHIPVRTRARGAAFGRDAGVLPGSRRPFAIDVWVRWRGQRRVFDQSAVAVAVASVTGLNEPI